MRSQALSSLRNHNTRVNKQNYEKQRQLYDNTHALASSITMVPNLKHEQ
jgi:hypothetical protein